MCHHIAWVISNGRFPEYPIDHINGIKTDNRPENLREAAGGMNQQNQRGAHKRSKTGVLGVIAYRNGFRATIRRGAKGFYLGDFKTIEEAEAAYLAAKRVLHSGCTI